MLPSVQYDTTTSGGNQSAWVPDAATTKEAEDAVYHNAMSRLPGCPFPWDDPNYALREIERRERETKEAGEDVAPDLAVVDDDWPDRQPSPTNSVIEGLAKARAMVQISDEVTAPHRPRKTANRIRVRKSKTPVKTRFAQTKTRGTDTLYVPFEGRNVQSKVVKLGSGVGGGTSRRIHSGKSSSNPSHGVRHIPSRLSCVIIVRNATAHVVRRSFQTVTT